MRKLARRMSFPIPTFGRGMMVCAAVLAVSSAFAAVEWPSDFDEKLAEHIAAEKSTNTTSEVYSMQVDSCYRTVASYGLAVSRTPGSGLYMIIR